MTIETNWGKVYIVTSTGLTLAPPKGEIHIENARGDIYAIRKIKKKPNRVF